MNHQAEGLSPHHLQASRKHWWDDRFTRLLLDVMPHDTQQIVELDCGMAGTAHLLLPALPDADYLGLFLHPERLAEAKAELEGSRLASKVELRLCQTGCLPLSNESADVMLSIMSLQHKADVPAVLAEVLRVLRHSGRLVAAEPDNLGQRFYFDGGLEEVSSAFHTLCLRARVARQPSDIALGPRLPSLMIKAGFHKIKMVAHVVDSSRLETANAFFGRLRRIAQIIAHEAGLGSENEQLLACEQAIKRCLFADMPKRLGFSCHVVPVFLCLGIKL